MKPKGRQVATGNCLNLGLAGLQHTSLGTVPGLMTCTQSSSRYRARLSTHPGSLQREVYMSLCSRPGIQCASPERSPELGASPVH